MGALGALIEAAINGSAVIGLDQIGKYHKAFGVKAADFWVNKNNFANQLNLNLFKFELTVF